MILTVKVLPKAKENKIIHASGFLKIKVTAAPEKGKANEKVIKLLADYFAVPKSRVQIISGLTTRKKLVKIET